MWWGILRRTDCYDPHTSFYAETLPHWGDGHRAARVSWRVCTTESDLKRVKLQGFNFQNIAPIGIDEHLLSEFFCFWPRRDEELWAVGEEKVR